MNWLKTALAAGSVLVTSAYAPATNVLIVGEDGVPNISNPLQPHFESAGFIVEQHDSIAFLDDADLSCYDLVWLANGVSSKNPSGSGAQVVPNPAGEANLLAYLQGGGNVFLPGEEASSFLEMGQWRDAFMTDSLGAGVINTLCNCDGGNIFFPDPEHPTGTTPNVVVNFGSGTVHTGQFQFIGTGTGILFNNAELTGDAIAAVWPEGTLANAPKARLAVHLNMNNTGDFASWAVNVAVWLAGDPGEKSCGADLSGDGVVDTIDLLQLLGAWGKVEGCDPADLNGDGVVDTIDLLQLLGAWGHCS